ncbi:hypothetical protein CMV_017228 [Castanea mollissima]|uniref:DUF674 domain-containing protein n=1 Tax=Castanea mollissima TaxID=60419 RepID=A0A8J4VIR3_9ROSI|nr:hypothetical protein CMV_017228 [Castanea mollissima]
MRKKVSFVDPPSVTNTGSSGGGGYVKGVVTYMIMDYLEVKPMSTISSITLHSKLNVKHMGALEEKVVELGMDERKNRDSTPKLEVAEVFSTSIMAVTNMSLKLLIDTENRKRTVGSFGNIYDSIENLSTTYLQPNVNKETLLKHKVHISGSTGEVPLLLPDIESSLTSTKFYRCSRSQNSNCHGYVADNCSALCPSCQGSMTCDVSFVDPPTTNNMVSSGGGYVKGVVTYMIMDDLEVKPMSTISSITLLNKFNVKQLGDLEEKVVELGMEEGVKLLKASLRSKNVLTDVFLPKLE